MNYRDHFAQHLRLTLLRVLAEAPGYAANSSILSLAVEQLGLAATRDQVRSELAWLDEQRLVTLLAPSSTLVVATLTERGHDVARGLSITPGIARPSPGQSLSGA